jgi:hypothetical protein
MSLGQARSEALQQLEAAKTEDQRVAATKQLVSALESDSRWLGLSPLTSFASSNKSLCTKVASYMSETQVPINVQTYVEALILMRCE